MKDTLKRTLLSVFAAAVVLIVLGFLLIKPQGAKSRHYAQLLEEADSMNRNYVPFTTDSVMLRVVRHYDHWWHPDSTRMKAYYLLGCAYRDLNNAPRALENYQRASELGDTTDTASLDRLMRIHSQMSNIYLCQRLPDLEKKELALAEKTAWILKDTLSALIFKEYFCNVIYNEHDYERCIEESQKLYALYKQTGFKNEAKLSVNLAIKSYMALGQYDQAKTLINIYESCTYFATNPTKINGGIGSLHFIKANYYLGTKVLDSAELYFKKVLDDSHFSNHKLLATKGLFKTYALKHQADSVLKYTQLYSDAKEKDFNSGIAEATAQARSLYDYSIEQKIARKKTKHNARLQNFLYLCFAIISSCIVVILFFMHRREREKLRFHELQQSHQRAINELQDLEELLRTEKGEKELNEKAINSLMRDIERQRDYIGSLERTLLKKDSRKNDMNLEDSDIAKRFQLIRTPKLGMDCTLREADWQQLSKTIEEIYPTFYDVMNGRQQLSQKEYRVCLLVKIGFGSSDIDVVMNQKPSFASITKKRLHKKVFGYEGTAADFEHKLHQF